MRLEPYDLIVHQANDLLRIEDVLLETNHIFVCKNTCKDDKKDYNYCVRNEENRILLYCQHAERWTSTLMMFLRCTNVDFGYKAFNDKNREVLSAVGKQCCFRNGVSQVFQNSHVKLFSRVPIDVYAQTVELMCGTHRLGSIQQSDGGTYKILDPDGSERFTLKKDGKGLYDVLAGSKANRKVGEIRQSWAELPLLEDIHIIYGVTLHPDLPLHEKYLIFGCSFLLVSFRRFW